MAEQRKRPKGPGGRGVKLDPDSKTVELRVYVPESLRDRIDEAAEESGQRRSEWVRWALGECLRGS